MKCKFCEYEWDERTDDPKSCPRCKRRMDYDIAKEKMVEMNFIGRLLVKMFDLEWCK